jgi:dephospho-CoA kinase
MSRVLRVALTGGIGSGKSTVADLFATHGAALIDADRIAHELTAAGGTALTAIVEVFGADLLHADGALDRARLRAIVFDDAAAKERLEAILHPRIRTRTEEMAATAARSAPYLVFVVPLLVESGAGRERFDRVLVVDCTVATQLQRVLARGIRRDQALQIIAQQARRQERLAAADDVLGNDGAVAELAPRVARLHKHYVTLN